MKKSSLLVSALLIASLAFSQQKTNEMINKEAIRNLYENILNNRKLEELNTLIAADYTNDQGDKGVAGFQKQIPELLKAFPDAKWTLTEIVAEGDKVFVKQKMQGTHKAAYLNIAATNKVVVNEGTAIYTLKNGKIIYHQVQTDRLGFLQQLGVVHVDLTPAKEKQVYFIGRFQIPEAAMPEFRQRTQYNRDFIKGLDGFIEDKVFEQKDEKGNYSLITIATWKSQEHLDAAKEKVRVENKRINFNPDEFRRQSNIQSEGGVYKN